MNTQIVNQNASDPDTDALYDTSPGMMAARMGASAAVLARMGDRRAVGLARLAATYALMVRPDLCPDKPQPFSEQLWKDAISLTRATYSRRLQ